MSENEKQAFAFYTAFQKGDAESMVNLYADNILFNDPAFGSLTGEKAKMMWRMLCANASDLKIEFKILSSENDQVNVAWEAYYTFSKTGRKVHNKIKASLIFKEAKIIQHHDVFDLHRWASQALGIKGMLLGWTGFFKTKLQGQTNAILQKFINNYTD